MILTGEDKAYEKAAGLGRLYVPWESYDKRFEERVARHVTTLEYWQITWNTCVMATA